MRMTIYRSVKVYDPLDKCPEPCYTLQKVSQCCSLQCFAGRKKKKKFIFGHYSPKTNVYRIFKLKIHTHGRKALALLSGDHEFEIPMMPQLSMASKSKTGPAFFVGVLAYAPFPSITATLSNHGRL